MEEPVTIVDREVLKVLAVDTRMDILKKLSEGSRTPSDLSKMLKKSDATIVEHLDTLCKVGLVKKIEQPGKKWVFYTLTERGKGIISSKSRKLVIIISLSLLALLSGSFGFFQTSTIYQNFLTEAAKATQPALGAQQVPSVPSIPLFPQLYFYLSIGLIILGVVGIAFYLVKKLKFKQGITMKPLVCFSILFLLLLSLANPVFAQKQAYWHSNDYYNVELSGSGNAFVVATITLESLSDKEVSSLTLQVPYKKIQIYKLAQGGGYWPCMGGGCPMYGPKYYDATFLDYTTESLADSTLVRINLTYPIVNSSQTTLYLVFSTPRIAKETFQGFEFQFKTIQDNDALTRYVGASISVPQNMELKGKPKFKVDYSPSELATMAAPSAQGLVEKISAYPYGNYQYSAQNLLPGESFTINGLYGEDFFLLYFWEIISVIWILMIFLIIFFMFIYGRIREMFTRRIEAEGIRKRIGFSWGRAFLAGGFSGFIFIFVFFILSFLSSLVFGGYYYGYQPALAILFFLIEGIILLVSLFGLPYYIGSRYNKSEGVVAGIIAIVSAFVLLVIVSILFQSSPPIYLLERQLGLAQTITGNV